MTTFNKTDLLSSKESGEEIYFFVYENHGAIIVLSNYDIEQLRLMDIRNVKMFAEIDAEEVNV